jgi:GntR family transcriptional regulator, arabinose operon transcriptional repressor
VDNIKLASGSKAGHKWQKIRDYIISELSSGSYSPGDAIPSENYLCEAVGVSRSTVRQAFRELENEGMIYRVKGRGTFLAEPDSSHKTNNDEMFGLIVPGIRRSLYPSLTQGFDDSLSLNSMQTLICQTNNDVDKQGNIILRLLHRGIDGVAIVPSTIGNTPAYQIQLLIDNGIPVVLCHRGVEGINVPTLLWDRKMVGRMAGEMLLEKGHINIAYFGVYKYEVSESHVLGLRQAMKDSGIELSDSNIIFGPAGDQPEIEVDREKILANLLLSDNRPTAIFCNDDNEAEVLYWLAQRLRISVPGDLSIVGFGDCHRSTSTRRFISSIVIDEYALGLKAAEILRSIKNGALNINYSKSIPVELNVFSGASIAKL